jgi:stage II sporulation protein D
VKGLHLFRHFYREITVWVFLVYVCSLFSPFVGYSEAEEIQKDIRVALFVDIGRFYQKTVPIVTLSSDSGLEIAGRTGFFQNIGDAPYMRFTLDQYHVIASESKQASEARNVSHQLSQNGFDNVVLQIKKNNEIIYRVVAGSEATIEEVKKKQEEIKTKVKLDTIAGGPFRVQAGSFATLEEATTRLDQIGIKEYAAYVSQVKQGDQHFFQVWVGDEVSATAQAELQNKLKQSFPSLTFQTVTESEYMIHLQGPLFSQQGESIPVYSISPQVKWTITPKQITEIPVISVEERNNRTYRGKIELSRYQNKFTVVNILPLDYYLYSVVGTEMSKGWPIEALKVQAVLSRNYSYMNVKANKYGIAHLSDTVFEQAYHGYRNEAEDIRQAVDATQGEFLTYKGNVFSTFYYSNAGGMTAEGREVWGNPVETHKSVTSKDSIPEVNAESWYRVQDILGRMGYVHSQYVSKITHTSKLGHVYGVINTPTLNYRSGPTTDHNNIIGSLKQSDQVLIIEEVKQNNSYSWVSGPFSGVQLQESINNRTQQSTQFILQPITTLSVSERGISGRVVQMEANGIPILRTSPDAYRSVFKEETRSLRSTKFEIEEAGDYTVLGAGGNKIDFPRIDAKPAQLYAISAGSPQSKVVNPNGDQFAIQGISRQFRIAFKAPVFLLHGFGYGHGLGASQWGIRGFAQEGYDYRQILQHYFHTDVLIEKKY